MKRDGVVSITIGERVAYKIICQTGGENILRLGEALKGKEGISLEEMSDIAVQVGFGSYMNTIVLDDKNQNAFHVGGLHKRTGYYNKMFETLQDPTHNPKSAEPRARHFLTVGWSMPSYER